MSACSKTLVVSFDGETLEAHPVRCKMRGCPTCAKFHRRRMMAKALSGEPEKMLTLTCNPAVGESPTDRAHLLIDGFALFLKRVKRTFRIKRIEYMWVLEATERGEPHLHVLLRSPFIPIAWIKATWCELTGAHIARIEKLHDARHASHYVAKYLSKRPAHYRGCRAYSCSRGWSKRPKLARAPRSASTQRRYLSGISAAWLLTLLQQQGWKEIRAGPQGIEAKAPTPGAAPPFWGLASEFTPFPKRRKTGSTFAADVERAAA